MREDAFQEEQDFVSPGSKIAAVVIVIALIAAGIMIYTYVTRTEVNPRVVVLGFTGRSEPIKEGLDGEITKYFERYGLIAERYDVSDKRELEIKAKELEAGHAVLVSTRVKESRPGQREGEVFAITETTVEVISVEEDEKKSATVTLGAFGPTAEAAMMSTQPAAMKMLFPEVVANIIKTEPIQALITTERLSLAPEDERAADILYKKNQSVATRRNAKAGLKRNCERSVEEAAEDEGPIEVRCHSGPCAEEYAVDLTRDGSRALIQSERYEPYFTLESSTVELVSQPERLELLNLEDGSRDLLYLTENFYGFASFSPDEKKVFFVENTGRGNTLVELDLATRERRSTPPTGDLISFPRISPDGIHLAMMSRTHRNGRLQAYLTRLDDIKPVRLVKEAWSNEWIEIDDPENPEIKRVLLATVAFGEETEEAIEPDAGPAPNGNLTKKHLLLIDPDTREAIHTVGGTEFEITNFAGTVANNLYFTSITEEQCRIGAYNLEEQQVVWLNTDVCLNSPRLAPDGALVGIVSSKIPTDPWGPDPEMFRVETETGRITRLTKNRTEERGIARVHGDTILFEKRLERFSRRLPLVSVCSAPYHPAKLNAIATYVPPKLEPPPAVETAEPDVPDGGIPQGALNMPSTGGDLPVYVVGEDGNMQAVDPEMGELINSALKQLQNTPSEQPSDAERAKAVDPGKLIGKWEILHSIYTNNGEASPPSKPLGVGIWESFEDGRLSIRAGMDIAGRYVYTGERLIVSGMGPKIDYRVKTLSSSRLEVVSRSEYTPGNVSETMVVLIRR